MEKITIYHYEVFDTMQSCFLRNTKYELLGIPKDKYNQIEAILISNGYLIKKGILKDKNE